MCYSKRANATGPIFAEEMTKIASLRRAQAFSRGFKRLLDLGLIADGRTALCNESNRLHSSQVLGLRRMVFRRLVSFVCDITSVSLSRALGFGLLRLLLGFMFGLFIYLVGSIVYSALIDAPATSLLTYLAVYVPVRWLEWSILGLLISPSARKFGVFWTGLNSRDRLWRLGGVLISCVADVPMIIALGGILPVGRFLC